MKAVRTLILIADGGKALFFRNDGPGKGLVALDQLDISQAVPRSQDLGEDRPGRVYSSVGSHRSGMEPRSDPHEQMEIEFLQRVVSRAQSVFEKDRAEKLVIAAAPRALGELRKALPKSLSGRLAATLDKDLTKIPEVDLPKHFEGVLAV